MRSRIAKLAEYIKMQDFEYRKKIANELYMSVSEFDIFLNALMGIGQSINTPIDVDSGDEIY